MYLIFSELSLFQRQCKTYSVLIDIIVGINMSRQGTNVYPKFSLWTFILCTATLTRDRIPCICVFYVNICRCFIIGYNKANRVTSTLKKKIKACIVSMWNVKNSDGFCFKFIFIEIRKQYTMILNRQTFLKPI